MNFRRMLLVVLGPCLWVALAVGPAAGCRSPAGPEALARRTGRIPFHEFEKFYRPQQHELLRSLEYTGYVILDATIDPRDGSLLRLEPVDAYPDSGRHSIATTLAQRVVLRPLETDSRIPAKARVYVVFYGGALDLRVAIIYARDKSHTGAVQRDGRFFDVTPY